MNIKCSYSELVDPNKLIPNPRNNNRHNIEQMAARDKALSKSPCFIRAARMSILRLMDIIYHSVTRLSMGLALIKTYIGGQGWQVGL